MVPGISFLFEPSLTPRLASVAPERGSTEGGTALTLTGSFPDAGLLAGNISVWLGAIPCEGVELVNATTITCTSARPASVNAMAPKPAGQLPVRVWFGNWGNAACGNASCGYQFVDLWSRRTTWGGEDLPGAGDSVLVPANTTVLLDTSASLYALVLEGSLVFDDTSAEHLQLDAHYILVKGGSLQVGREDAPFPGQATITLHGTPDDRELPLYGAKVGSEA
jgi:hypothetical protein